MFKPRIRIRYSHFIAYLVVAALIVLSSSTFAGFKVYERLAVRRKMTEAKTRLDARDFRGATTALMEVFRENPQHLMACRMLGTALENLKSPEALIFRQKAVAIAIDSLDSAVELTRTALNFGNIPKAELGIQLILKNKPADASFLPPLQAHLAMLKEDKTSAALHYAEALQMEPANDYYRVSLAGLQVASDDYRVRDEARTVLNQLSSHPKYRLLALRGLVKAGIQDAREKRDFSSTYALADDLVTDKNSAFDDRLLRLTLLRITQDSFYKPYLAQLQKEAAKSAPALNAMIRWTVQENAAVECAAWLNAIPSKFLKKPPLAKSMVEAFLQQEKWDRVIDLTMGEDWEASDHLRLGYLAVAEAKVGRISLAETLWRESLATTPDPESQPRMLREFAENYSWTR
ncbi:MAG TPA: hypothetical protein VF585_00620 [Chthoniobacterales bacterium]|jgi:hypothetical protein